MSTYYRLKGVELWHPSVATTLQFTLRPSISHGCNWLVGLNISVKVSIVARWFFLGLLGLAIGDTAAWVGESVCRCS